MAITRGSSVTLRPDLGEYYREFVLNTTLYAGHKVLPFHKVDFKTNEYKRISADAAAQLPNANYSGRGAYPRAEMKVDADTYNCKYYGIETELPDAERGELENFFNLESECANFVLGINRMNFEKRVADAIFNTTTWPLSGTTGLSVSNPWSNISSGTPIDNIHTGIQTLLDINGEIPDALLITYQTYMDLLQSNQVRDKLKYDGSEKGPIPLTTLANALGLVNPSTGQPGTIILVSGTYNSSNLDKAASFTSLWNRDNAFLFYMTPQDANGNAQPGTMASKPQIGRTFVFDKFGSPDQVEEYREDSSGQDVYRSRWSTDEKVFGTRFGFLFGNVD